MGARIGMTFEEMTKRNISPCNTGNGWHLVTNDGWSRVVLCGQGRHRQRPSAVSACDEAGLLSEEAAVPVLQRIATLWNEAAQKVRAGTSPVLPSPPVLTSPPERPPHRHVPARQGDAGNHLYEIRSPFEVGDRVLTESEGTDVGTICRLTFHVEPSGRVERRAVVDFTKWQVSRKVEDLRPAPVARSAEIKVGDRVSNLAIPGERAYGRVTAMYLRDEDEVLRVTVRWDSGTLEGNFDPAFLRLAL